MKVNDIPKEAEQNAAIFDSYVKARSVLEKYDSAMASISGGADSDVVLDILARLDADHRIRYVWFNTGLEYKATRDHLDFLEEKYGIEIERFRPKKSVPTCCREYGQPFLNKHVSEQIHSLQINHFDFTDMEYEEMAEKVGVSNAKWWHNRYCGHWTRGNSVLDIRRNKYLKEFLIDNPPTFPISDVCCDWAKKKTAKAAWKASSAPLNITGVRRAEGGIRSYSYTNCYTISGKGPDSYRPIFWYTNEDRAQYKALFDIRNSDCYEVWGFTRTGCVGCPFNRKLEEEQETMNLFEPQMYKACNHVFGDSYKYTKLYRDYAANRKELEKYRQES